MINIKSNASDLTRRLKAIGNGVGKATSKGLARWALLAHREAHKLLSGSGKPAPGSYPVPVRSGHLRRSEDYVLPGRSKHGITAGDSEAWLVNSAEYARPIHDGTGTQRRFGRRRFMADAIENTRKDGLNGISEHIRKALLTGGLA